MMIVNHVEDNQTLISLCLVSSNLSEIATKRLYENTTWTPERYQARLCPSPHRKPTLGNSHQKANKRLLQ